MQYVPASAGFMTVLQQLRTCIETPKTNEWNKEHNINLSHLTLQSPYQGWTPRPVGTLPEGRGGSPPCPSCGEGGFPAPAPGLPRSTNLDSFPAPWKKSFPVHPCFSRQACKSLFETWGLEVRQLDAMRALRALPRLKMTNLQLFLRQK